MANPSNLQDWLAGDKKATSIILPVVFSSINAEELLPWHPTEVNELKLVPNPQKADEAILELTSDNWDMEWAEMTRGTSFKLAPLASGDSRMISTSVGPSSFGVHQWQLISWELFMILVPGSEEISQVQELLTWKSKDNEIAQSSYGWHPYRS